MTGVKCFPAVGNMEMSSRLTRSHPSRRILGTRADRSFGENLHASKTYVNAGQTFDRICAELEAVDSTWGILVLARL